MGSKTNRSLQVKHERSKVQKMEQAYAEMTKAPFLMAKARDRAFLATALVAFEQAKAERIERRARLSAHF